MNEVFDIDDAVERWNDEIDTVWDALVNELQLCCDCTAPDDSGRVDFDLYPRFNPIDARGSLCEQVAAELRRVASLLLEAADKIESHRRRRIVLAARRARREAVAV